jgi:hypothetical protein
MTDANNETDCGASRSDAGLDVQFVTEPDELGRGRVIVNGRFFSLPMEAVNEYKVLRDEVKKWHDFGRALASVGMNGLTVPLVPNAQVTSRPSSGD